ncbi:MAG: MarR family winged helix-turn-helix transcriptional regulator, partial [Saezia sp.]
QQYSDAPGDIILATRLLVRSAQMLESRINASLDSLGLQIPEYLAMMVIKFEDGPIRPTELSESLGISRPQITRLLDSLEQRGLITREHSKTDRRALVLMLTSKGGNQLKAAAPIVHRAYLDCWKHSTKDVEPMLAGLKNLYVGLTGVNEKKVKELAE